MEINPSCELTPCVVFKILLAPDFTEPVCAFTESYFSILLVIFILLTVCRVLGSFYLGGVVGLFTKLYFNIVIFITPAFTLDRSVALILRLT